MIDLLRWTAALTVLITHAAALQTQPNTPPYEYLGHPAVIIFFVISGYLIGGRPIPDIPQYLLNRTVRIYIVFIPALILTVILDHLGQLTHSPLYVDPHLISLNTTPSSNTSAYIFLKNLLMLQTIKSPTLGSNGPVWSLANEWWYYMIYAASQRRQTAPAAVLILFLLPTQISLYFIVWCLGAYAARTKMTAGTIGPLILFPVTVYELVYDQTHNAPLFYDDVCLAFVTSYLINSRARVPALHSRLASFSYSLYLTHFPLILCLTAYGAPVTVTIPTAIIAAYLFARVTEAQTTRLKNYIIAKAAPTRHNDIVQTGDTI